MISLWTKKGSWICARTNRTDDVIGRQSGQSCQSCLVLLVPIWVLLCFALSSGRPVGVPPLLLEPWERPDDFPESLSSNPYKPLELGCCRSWKPWEPDLCSDHVGQLTFSASAATVRLLPAPQLFVPIVPSVPWWKKVFCFLTTRSLLANDPWVKEVFPIQKSNH